MKKQFFIEAKVKNIDKNIEDAIKRAGIMYPHPSLAFFRATYAKIGENEFNGNGVALGQSVKNDVKYLIGTQVNRDHLREGYLRGHIIDAYVTNNDEIEIVFIYEKDMFAKEYNEALELMEKGELTVSFELKVDNDNIKTVENGKKVLSKVDFCGVGMLFGIQPAYSNAYVLTTAMKIIEDTFNGKNKELICASAKDITKKWTRVGELIEKALTENEKIYSCECINCGKKQISNKHCKNLICSECGGQMRRVDRPGSGNSASIKDFDENEELQAKKWTTKFINSLPNSSFAVIEPDYLNNKTDNKNARHLPFKDKNGKVDLPHYRNALARVNQIKPITNSISTEDLRKQAKKVLDKYKNLLKGNQLGGDNNMDEKAKKALLAKQKEFIVEEFGEEAVKDWSDEDYLNQEKIDALRESIKAEKEKSEKDLEASKSKTTTTSVYEVVEDTEKGTMDVIETITTISEVDGVETKNEKVVRNTLYTFAKVEELVKEAKEEVKVENENLIAEKEMKLKDDLEAKDVELKAKTEEIEFLKENAVKIVKIRAEFGDFVKELSDKQLFDETLMEIAKLKKELAEEKAKSNKQTVNTALKKDDLSASVDDDTDESEELKDAKKVVAKQKAMKQIIAKINKK